MRFSFRLAELLHYTPDPKKRPGVIKSIVEATGLDRHHVAALLRNGMKHIPLDALSRLCDYLVENGYASPDELPGALFAVQAENFWELLARRRRLKLCVGVRRADNPDWPDAAWVVASDSVLLGELLNGVSTLGGTAKLLTEPMPDGKGKSFHPQQPHPENLQQALVWSPGGPVQTDEAMKRAFEVYDEFHDQLHDKALVSLGSTKSNPVSELVVARAFDCEPFKPEYVDTASERKCPFYMRFRDRDPHPDSCWGGLELSRKEPSPQPGIYYEQADGQWACCPCDGSKNDAAFLFYVYHESQGWLEMTMGGFSGRATRLLARTLASRAQDFWPPSDREYGRDVGAFVVRYTLPPESDKSRDPLRTDITADAEIIRLDESVIRRRWVSGKRTAESGESETGESE